MNSNFPVSPLSFTTSYSGKSNKLINKVLISLPESIDVKFEGLCKPEFIALWDTGATNTVINKNVVDQCGLIPIGITECYGVNGKHQSNVYLVNIYLPNKVVIPNLTVTEGVLKDIDVLVGMDVMGLGDFAVSNYKGITTFSFRFPSIETIDFVAKKPIVNPSGKIGRNEKCPCGSGKKYKNCCGK